MLDVIFLSNYRFLMTNENIGIKLLFRMNIKY